MAYVPPHLRNRNKENEQPVASAKSQISSLGDLPPGHKNNTRPVAKSFSRYDDRLVSHNDIQDHYWPLNEDGSPSLPRTSTSYTGILNASARDPSRLTYILIFYDSNPRWEDIKVIYSKTRIDLLPGCPTREVPATTINAGIQTQHSANFVRIELPNGSVRVQSHEVAEANPSTAHDDDDADGPDVRATTVLKPLTEPIAVFEQVRAGRTQDRTFMFAGWHRVLTTAYHKPFSQGLTEMLMQKWNKRDSFGKKTEEKRDASQWRSSLSHHWADVKLVSDEEADKQLSAPEIKITSPEQPSNNGKTVNELLTEMRMTNSGNRDGDPS